MLPRGIDKLWHELCLSTLVNDLRLIIDSFANVLYWQMNYDLIVLFYVRVLIESI